MSLQTYIKESEVKTEIAKSLKIAKENFLNMFMDEINTLIATTKETDNKQLKDKLSSIAKHITAASKEVDSIK